MLASFENKPDHLSRQEVVYRLLVRFCASWLPFDREEDLCSSVSRAAGLTAAAANKIVFRFLSVSH